MQVIILLLALCMGTFAQSNLRGVDIVIDCYSDTSSNDSDVEGYMYWDEFVSFQERFNKRYSNEQELQSRFSIFQRNVSVKCFQ